MAKFYPYSADQVLLGHKARQHYGWADGQSLGEAVGLIEINSGSMATAGGDTFLWVPPANMTLLYALWVTKTAFATADGEILAGIIGDTNLNIAATALPYAASAAGDIVALTIADGTLTKGTPFLVTLTDNSSTAGIGFFQAWAKLT